MISSVLCNEDGNWQISQITAGDYELFIDSTNHFPSNLYEIILGSKQQFITVVGNQELNIILEINQL